MKSRLNAEEIVFTGPRQAQIRQITVTDPDHGEVQVRTLANGICMFEVSLFTGAEPTGFPREVGHEGIGVVEKVGKGVQTLQEGDFVTCGKWRTVQNVPAWSAHPLSRQPADPGTFLVEPANCVVIAVRSYDIVPGDRVLVIGAGYMGLLNVQLLARCPLAELIVADVKPRNLALAKQFGATEVIDAATSAGRERLEALEKNRFDLVVEAAGAAPTLAQATRLVRAGGKLGIFAWHHEPRPVDLSVWHMQGIRVMNCAPNIGRDRNEDTWGRAIRLLECGTFDMAPLVTNRDPMERVQEAMELAAERPADYIKGVLTFPVPG
jgi:threonine dehydrogenase-like Zn-dependent dehydrogenase